LLFPKSIGVACRRLKSVVLLIACLTAAPAIASSLADTLRALAPGASPHALQLAARALACAARAGEPAAERLAVIDYSKPSTEPRMWVFDLHSRQLLFKELVAHGRGSGEEEATRFSNRPQSFASSLGLFRTLETYDGRNGYSLRLEGLDRGLNDRAYDRAIVIHGADYVSEDFIQQTGRLGRSHGCPAVRQSVARPLIDTLKNDQYLFAYHPRGEVAERKAYANCSLQLAAN
jgi:hypothetical protein